MILLFVWAPARAPSKEVVFVVRGAITLKCPYCGFEESKVTDSRPIDDGTKIRRRRECANCNARFTTYEMVETLPIIVVKKDKSREAYDRSKVLAGMLKSCEKRQISLATIEASVDQIEQKIQNSMLKEVKSSDIGEYVMEALKDIDKVAYVRFAAVYRDFDDIDSLMEDLKRLLVDKK